MPKFANAHLVLNSRDRNLPGSRGVYNNFIVANPGQNLVQGQMKDTALSEVLFPYDLPNVMPGFNTFQLASVDPEVVLEVVVPPGFYTGTEFATAVTDAIEAAATDAGETPADWPTCDYDAVTNRFSFLPPVGGPYAADGILLASPYLYPANYAGPAPTYTIGKDILTIMGMPPLTQVDPPLIITDPFEGNSAPLIFTQYIDICSPALCQYQFIRDGSTTSLPRRVDLICRLYIEDETSMPQAFDVNGNYIPTGCRPFVIHRQFKNQRVMRNTATNAINDVDIQLYDDCGQPLATAWAPRDFQITFHVYEADDTKSEANIGYRY